MPELPDLQVFSRNLTRKLKGKQVKKVSVPVSKKLNVPVHELATAIEGTRVEQVVRVGKELHMLFSNKQVLGLHLMLHGQLFIFEGDNTNKHTIIALMFTDNTGFAMTDYQGIAAPTLNPEDRAAPDALAKEINTSFLKKQLAAKRTSIKNFLLDQHSIRGIGNAYADEILWDARISPFSVCNKLPEAAIKKLASSIKSVLHHAEKEILKNDPEIISGEKRDFLLIHNAKKAQSPDGAEIRQKMVASRKTYYTDEQELYE